MQLNVSVNLSDKEIDFLNKYSFLNEIPIDNFTVNEKLIINELKEKGFLFSYIVFGKEEIKGTLVYKLFIKHTVQ